MLQSGHVTKREHLSKNLYFLVSKVYTLHDLFCGTLIWPVLGGYSFRPCNVSVYLGKDLQDLVSLNKPDVLNEQGIEYQTLRTLKRRWK